MFKILTSLAKASVATALLPVAVAVDVVTLPGSAMDPRKGPFDTTGKLLGSIGGNVVKAVDPED